mgnify:CR=1 FL=1
MERSYTVKEVDALKAAHKDKFLWGSYNGPCMKYDNAGYSSRTSAQYKEADLRICVEDATRTSIIAGHVAADLLASERDKGSE